MVTAASRTTWPHDLLTRQTLSVGSSFPFILHNSVASSEVLPWFRCTFIISWFRCSPPGGASLLHVGILQVLRRHLWAHMSTPFASHGGPGWPQACRHARTASHTAEQVPEEHHLAVLPSWKAGLAAGLLSQAQPAAARSLLWKAL